MTTLSKRRKGLATKVDRAKAYAVFDAMKLVKETATAKFDEAVDVAVNLGIDAKKSDQTVRGSVVLPAGTGKKGRVAGFAPGDKGQAAQQGGPRLPGRGATPGPDTYSFAPTRRASCNARSAAPRSQRSSCATTLRRWSGHSTA